MSWDDADFDSDDPFVRYSAHQLAKGRNPLPDPDLVRKQQKEHGCTCGGRGICTRCVLDDIERMLP